MDLKAGPSRFHDSKRRYLPNIGDPDEKLGREPLAVGNSEGGSRSRRLAGVGIFRSYLAECQRFQGMSALMSALKGSNPQGSVLGGVCHLFPSVILLH